MDDFNHNLLASSTLYAIKDVRELDGGHQLDVKSTTGHRCKVRTGLAYSDANIVQATALLTLTQILTPNSKSYILDHDNRA